MLNLPRLLSGQHLTINAKDSDMHRNDFFVMLNLFQHLSTNAKDSDMRRNDFFCHAELVPIAIGTASPQ